MDYNENYQDIELATSLQRHAIRTFGWMALGLLVTAIVAVFVLSTNLVYMIYANPIAPIVLLIAQIGVVIALASRLTKLAPSSALILFLLYAVLVGVTFSSLGIAYGLGTLGFAFLVTAVYFGCLAVIGLTTKMNMLRFGPILFAALIALVVCELIMMLLHADINTMLFSAIGLLIFTGITVYDAQKMKALYMEYQNDETMLSRLSIYSAFSLYLDFINIFLYILRFVGNRN